MIITVETDDQISLNIAYATLVAYEQKTRDRDGRILGALPPIMTISTKIKSNNLMAIYTRILSV